MNDAKLKINASNLIASDYRRTCNVSRYMPDLMPAESMALEQKFFAVRGAKSVGKNTPVKREPIFFWEEKKVIQPAGTPAPAVTSQPEKTPEKEPKGKPKKKTAEELAAAAEKRALDAARKKAIKQQYCVLDPYDLLTMKIEDITAELVEFYEKDPDNPVAWDLILTMLGDLSVWNTDPKVRCNKRIPKAILQPIVEKIFRSDRWTPMMMTSLNHYKDFFGQREWRKIKKRFYQVVYDLYIQIIPAEEVAKVAHLKKLPHHIFDAFRSVWDFLWHIPLAVW